MPEVNLKDYFNRLSNLLGDNAADEIIHHCRHILRYYPKNVNTYRFLGQALVIIGRWDEAQAALRRVLSVIPDDFVANVKLGEVYDQTNHCDDAIWYYERALDQRPGDKNLLNSLRDLYHRCRHTGQLKIQMTAGSVAQQHRRAGADEYAIETLRSALKQTPERVDLQLLLAEIFWDMGREDEAAENALDVLNVLPDCLAANRILAQLWLSVGRPSDAQLYVNRIESVDPYLAVELVQGTPPEDDAFRVDELDFKRSAQTEMVSSRPDWLSALGTTEAEKVDEASAQDESPAQSGSWSSGMLSPRPDVAAPAEESDVEWLGALPTREDPIFDTADASDEELNKLFGSGGLDASTPAPAYTPPEIPEEGSPFAWMESAGVELVENSEAGDDEPTFADLFDEPDAPILEQDDNPLAWMQQYDPDNMIIGEESPTSAALPDNAVAEYELIYNQDDYPEQESLYELPPYPDAAEPENTLEELDWMRGASEDDELFSETSDSANEFELPAAEPNVQPGGLRGLTSILSEANLDWLQKPGQDEDALDVDSDDDWMNQFSPPSAAPAPVTDSPDWLSTLEGKPEDITFDNDTFTPAESVAGTSFDMNKEELDLMSEFERPENQEEPQGSEMPDWLSEFEPKDDADDAASAGATEEANEEFSWSNLSTYEEIATNAATPADDAIPDWLSEAAPETSYEAAPTVGGTDFDWLTDDALASAEAEISTNASLEPGDDWLTEFAPSGEAAAGSLPVMELPDTSEDSNDLDWLNSLDSTPTESVADTGTLAEPVGEAFNADLDSIDAIPDWLTEIQPEEPALSAAEDAADDDAPDWLSEMQPEGASLSAVEDVAADDAPDWLSELQPESVEIEPAGEINETEAAIEDIPDWLAEVQPDTAAAAVASHEMTDAEETFAWLDAMPAIDLPETELPDEVAAAFEDETDEPVSAPVAEFDEFEWDATESERLAIDEFAADTGDADTNDAAWALPSPVVENAEDTLIFRPNELDVSASLEGIIPEADADDPFAALVGEGALDNLDEFEDDELADWASEIADEPVEDAVAEDIEYEPVLTEAIEEVIEPTPADNAPDWLNAMVPGLDVDYEAQEDVLPDEEFEEVAEVAPEPAASSEFGWLERIVEDEIEADTAALAAAQPRFVFSKSPAWLRSSSQPDDDLPDWPVEDDDTPDWLR